MLNSGPERYFLKDQSLWLPGVIYILETLGVPQTQPPPPHKTNQESSFPVEAHSSVSPKWFLVLGSPWRLTASSPCSQAVCLAHSCMPSPADALIH